MSEQFNMKHGAVKRTFNVNERVYIKDFQQKKRFMGKSYFKKRKSLI